MLVLNGVIGLTHHEVRRSGDPKIGAGDAIVVEPRTVVREYAGRWDRTAIDHEELARLRLVEGWELKRLEAHFACGRTKIKKELRKLRSNELFVITAKNLS